MSSFLFSTWTNISIIQNTSPSVKNEHIHLNAIRFFNARMREVWYDMYVLILSQLN